MLIIKRTPRTVVIQIGQEKHVLSPVEARRIAQAILAAVVKIENRR